MTTKINLYVRQFDTLNTVIVTIPGQNFGSTNVELLQVLHVSLDEAATGTDSETVILDLSDIEISGSGFLTCLDLFQRQLASAGRQLVVCGDRTGLIELVNWAGRMRYQVDLTAALNASALQPA